METGAVGFILQLLWYILIYKKIKKIKSKEVSVYKALLWAVVVVNSISNSYLSRFGLAQLFFMLLVYIELPDRENNTTKNQQVTTDESLKSHRVLRLTNEDFK